MKTAATKGRDFRTFLLVSQFEAKAIGARIAQERNESGLTQEELAEMASFSKRSLQDYESGHTIPYRHMREISALLRKPVEWFLHGEQETEAAVADRLGEILLRLEVLEAKVDELPTAEQVQAGLDGLRAAIDAQANRGTRSGSGEKKNG